MLQLQAKLTMSSVEWRGHDVLGFNYCEVGMISVITPTNNPKYLLDCWESLKNQTFQDFEWVIVPNNGCCVDLQNEKICVVPYTEATQSIGKIKNFAFSQGKGDWLLELDHDDILLPTALEELSKVGSDFDFAYCNTANFHNETWKPDVYNRNYGWSTKQFEYQGHALFEHISFEPTPASLRLIYWAPNHFRAWRREFYHKIGGHSDLPVCDDHELVIKTYLNGSMKRIGKCLYLYRIVGNEWNQWLKNNKDIQKVTHELQDKYIYQLIERWAYLNNLKKIDLGGRFGCPKGYISVDRKDAEICCNLNDCWPLLDNSVGVVRAFDILEHLSNPVHTMSEIHRVLAPGGYLISMTPSTDGRGAFQDPTHITFWNENSFWYYTRAEQAKYTDNNSIRFQTMRLKTDYPSDWHRQHNISYVYADLAVLKDRVDRLPGLVEI